MKTKMFFAVGLLLLAVAPAYATVCANANGVPTDISYDLSNVFSSANNNVGQVVSLDGKNGWIGVEAICPAGTIGYTTLRSYVTDLPVVEEIDGFKYLKINDYLEGGMQIWDPHAEYFYPPGNYIQMGADANVPNQSPFRVRDQSLVFRLKVTRRFIDMVPITRRTMFTVYVTTTQQDPLITPVYTISYSGRVEVPQYCELNVGQIVEFDFGDIGAALFSQAGAGHIPQGVNPQTKRVGIKCTNVDAQAYLTLRLEAEKSSGNIMVSDNRDLGFVVLGASERGSAIFTPNNIDSKIGFQLDGAASANVSISAFPVSVTGNKPAEGPFTARGYLRVDYD